MGRSALSLLKLWKRFITWHLRPLGHQDALTCLYFRTAVTEFTLKHRFYCWPQIQIHPNTSSFILMISHIRFALEEIMCSIKPIPIFMYVSHTIDTHASILYLCTSLLYLDSFFTVVMIAHRPIFFHSQAIAMDHIPVVIAWLLWPGSETICYNRVQT